MPRWAWLTASVHSSFRYTHIPVYTNTIEFYGCRSTGKGPMISILSICPVPRRILTETRNTAQATNNDTDGKYLQSDITARRLIWTELRSSNQATMHCTALAIMTARFCIFHISRAVTNYKKRGYINQFATDPYHNETPTQRRLRRFV
jgi:hypothetical protein